MFITHFVMFKFFTGASEGVVAAVGPPRYEGLTRNPGRFLK